MVALLFYVEDAMVTRNDEREQHELNDRLTKRVWDKGIGKTKLLDIEATYSMMSPR